MSVLVCVYVDLVKMLNELLQLYKDYYPSALSNERSRLSPLYLIVGCIFSFFIFIVFIFFLLLFEVVLNLDLSFYSTLE